MSKYTIDKIYRINGSDGECLELSPDSEHVGYFMVRQINQSGEIGRLATLSFAQLDALHCTIDAILKDKQDVKEFED